MDLQNGITTTGQDGNIVLGIGIEANRLTLGSLW